MNTNALLDSDVIGDWALKRNPFQGDYDFDVGIYEKRSILDSYLKTLNKGSFDYLEWYEGDQKLK